MKGLEVKIHPSMLDEINRKIEEMNARLIALEAIKPVVHEVHYHTTPVYEPIVPLKWTCHAV